MMKKINMWRVKKWTTIFGALMLMLPIGLPWYWGNMSIYALSYVALRGQTDKDVLTPWIISLYFLSNAIGLFLVGLLSKFIRKRVILICGIVLYLSGIFLTFLSVKISVMMMNLTLGLVSGIGGGIINGMALQYAVAWAREDLGFVTALVQSGFNGGPVFINPFVTMYVNPDDKPADLDFGPSKFFSQDDVLDQVPSFFITFGFLCFGFQILGFLLVRDCSTSDCNQEEIELNGRDSNEKHNMEQLQTSATQANANGQLGQQQQTQTQFTDKKPSEIIKTRNFYTLWLALMFFDNAMLILANYYKEYGATMIKDDYFLTFLGTVLTLATIVAIPAWGYLTDRIGVKRSLIYMYSVSSVLSFLMYFAPKLSKWAYLVNIAFSGSFLPPIFSVLIIATCKLFGKTHYSSNIGVVASFSLLINFVNPIIFEEILNIGWFYVFLYAGCLTMVAMIIVVLTMPTI